ncbi:MAG: nitronate monooxygenase family protein [Candidatus Omnitrophica bacterium]|nr:nitronate monooxygenase family protein [Candidatus Omnitrophota bacterium]
MSKLNPLVIGDLTIKVPIIQGGMGVKVSTAPLVSAVANCQAAGTIASVGLAYGTPENESDYLNASKEALRKEIRKSRELTSGVIGVNIMVALTNYQDLVQVAVEEKADFIVSGAGLPLRLPEFTKGSSIKLIPIVSSAKATKLIIKTWVRRYQRLPDAIVVEGPLAGGHLGFRFEELNENSADSLESLVSDVIRVTEEYAKESNVTIPVIAGGGIFDGKDIAKFIKLGAKGVQMATRFVATEECSVADEFKELYLKAEAEDIVIIKSPVGLPGRAIKTSFIEKMVRGEKHPVSCPYKCLITCDPATVPYCIAKALCNASIGDLDNAVVFTGSNVSKVKAIVPVKQLIDELVDEAAKELASG